MPRHGFRVWPPWVAMGNTGFSLLSTKKKNARVTLDKTNVLKLAYVFTLGPDMCIYKIFIYIDMCMFICMFAFVCLCVGVLCFCDLVETDR